MAISIGSPVRWSDEGKDYTGLVIAMIPAGALPATHGYPVPNGEEPREAESPIVLAGNGFGALANFWPDTVDEM